MAGINKVTLVGNLGTDPELRYTAGGTPVANFRVATNEAWTDRNGQKQERTEWHRIVVWGRSAELCGEYLCKGRQIFIDGRLQTREWTDKESRRQFTTEVVANQVLFLGGAGRRAAPGDDDLGPPPPGFTEEEVDRGDNKTAGSDAPIGPSEDDIPF